MIPIAGKHLQKQWHPLATACGRKQSMHQLANSLPSLSKRTERHAHG